MDLSEHYPDSSSSVALACRTGDVEALRVLLGHGKSVDSQDNRGWRPIHEAASWDHADCIRCLIETGGAQLNSYTFEGQTPLWIASQNNSLQAARALLQAGATVNLPNNEDVTPLHCASSKGHVEMVALLLDNGANPNLPDYGLYTPLHEAAIEGHEKIVELLIQQGADKLAQDSHGRSPLFCGSQAHNCSVVKLLGLDSSSSYVDLRAHDGATALMLTAQSGCLDCIKFLVDQGADPNVKANDGVMAVHLAVTSGHINVLEYLLDITDHNVISECCNPSVDLAISDGQLENGWNRNSQESVNIFTLAVTYERLDCIHIFLAKGLRPDEYPCLWKYRNRSVISILELDYPFATPLSFILCYSPFNIKLLDLMKDLVKQGSKTKQYSHKFVPPIVSLLFAPGWVHEFEEPFLRSTFNHLIHHTESLQDDNISQMMAIALLQVPWAFTQILHMGYLFNESSFFFAYKSIYPRSEPIPETLKALRSAGLVSELFFNNEGHVHSLKQLSRRAARHLLWKSNLKIPALKAELPIPASLISYLCYDDINFY